MRQRLTTILLGLAFTWPATAVAGDGVEWQTWNGRLPRHAIQGGVDLYGTAPLYICRARHVNGVHPGKLLNRRCHIAWGGSEVVLHQFEVLVATNGPSRERDRRR